MFRGNSKIKLEFLNDEQLKEAIVMFKQGHGYARIGTHFGHSYSKVGKQLKELGYKRTLAEANMVKMTCKKKGTKHEC